MTSPATKTRRKSGDRAMNGRPPFHSGDHLTRAEFERRYQMYPEIKKAELIEGIVYVSSPMRNKQHGRPQAILITWLTLYMSKTPGIAASDNATVRLDYENEVQPDGLLYVVDGGNLVETEDDYLEGAPELVAEIAASSVAYDLYDKRHVYARNGVQEYVAFQVYEKKIDWFVWREGQYFPLEPDESGILRSEYFPGLWLDTVAFWEEDVSQLIKTLNQGLSSPAHATFVEQLKS